MRLAALPVVVPLRIFAENCAFFRPRGLQLAFIAWQPVDTDVFRQCAIDIIAV
jgi:hypothetical protein